jgi:hydrogenase expression/formation protein HypE
MSSEIDFSGWTCPLPLRDYPNIVLGHGGGGKLSAELVENLFVPAFRNPAIESLGDAAILNVPPGRLAFSTDSYVVHPLFFPGGSIGELAINGTINDIAMSGGQPFYLSVAFILEEGLPMATLGQIVECMRIAARSAGVQIVTGDTKVVEKGHGDGCFINTSGIGVIPEGREVGPGRAKAGDVIIVSGTLGDHGMAVMSVREGLEFESVIRSDSAALNSLAEAIFAASSDIHVLRDPTRGGLASSLNEIAAQSHVGMALMEENLPVKPEVQAACELLGMDPIYVANEGKLVAIAGASSADAVLTAMRRHPLGADAAIVGTVVADRPGMLMAKTKIGGTRVIPMQIGEQLPRIC